MVGTVFHLTGGITLLGVFVWGLRTGSARGAWRVRVDRNTHPFGYWFVRV
jgi:hypothetical protein